MKNIAIDLDDVTGDFNTAFASWHNRVYGTNVTYRKIFTFDLPRVYGISHALFNERVQEFFHYHHDTMQLITGAKEGFETLRAWSLVPHIVTSRWNSLYNITWSYINRELSNLVEDVHFVNNHHEHHGNKRKTCQKLRAIALMEDAPHHAVAVAAGNIPVLLHDRPWNHVASVTQNNIIRCGKWKIAGSEWKAALEWIE